MDALQHPALRRALYASDIFANITTLLSMVMFVSKTYGKLPPGQAVKDTHFVPRHWLFNTWMTFSLLTAVTVAALWMMTCRRNCYVQHRTAICTAVRLVRFYVQTSTNLTPSAVAPFAYSLATRVQEVPHLAVATVMLQPMAFYMQSSLILLPWRRMMVIQLATTVLILQWAYQLPCFLQLLHTDPGPPMWQEQAERSCNMLQSFTVVLLTAVGVPLSLFSDSACIGLASAQTLQIFSTFLTLFVIPTAAAVGVQRWAELQHRQQQQQQQEGVAGHSRNASNNNNSSNRLPGRAINSVLNTTRVQGFGALREVHVLLLVLLLMLPSLWLLAETLSGVFEGGRDCAAILASAGIQ